MEEINIFLINYNMSSILTLLALFLFGCISFACGHGRDNDTNYYGRHSLLAMSRNQQTFADEGPPSPLNKAATARWLAHNTGWGSISTIQATSRERPGSPFGNICSFSDGPSNNSTGTLYFLHSPLDASMIDVMENDLVSFALSEMQTGYCQGKEYDAEDPRCARLSLSGHLVSVTSSNEIKIAETALFTRHPVMEDWYNGSEEDSHAFSFWKLELEEIWLIDSFGGAALIDIDAWNRGTDQEGESLSPKISSIPVGYIRSANNRNHVDKVYSGTINWFAAILCVFVFGFVVGRHSSSQTIRIEHGNARLLEGSAESFI